LFIDEIGKFITESNNYFFAPAAPMIYGAILLLAAIWLIVARRRDRASAHEDLQAGVEAMREAVDGQLTPASRARALERLERVRTGADTAQARVATAQAELLRSPAVEAVMARPGWAEGSGPRELVERLLPARIERILILLLLLGTALIALLSALVLIAVLGGERLDLPQPSGPVEFPEEPIWAILLFIVSIVVGIASGFAFVQILRGRVRQGLRIGIWAALGNLVAGGLLTFYVTQFGAMASAIGHLILLLLLLDHDRRLAESPGAIDPHAPVTAASR
ncbi:MAG TPA: hypothetical protein VES19_03125, partial [Candidatus Limnocylindrales bacterium]|nr:hypothetical protein [Candidatus Limnocylindrales bacterium]